MYKAFKIENCTIPEFQACHGEGEKIFNEDSENLHKSLESYINKNNYLDGELMQVDWFPQIKADIFISHSHKDKALAIALAGWLKRNLKLTAFVDSCIWGHSADLLKIIDDKYCIYPNKDSYCYNKRNHSTSHVYMMLLAAINKMIDNTECLFFLNTSNSSNLSDIEDCKTTSPWIYAEMEISRTIRIKEHRNKQILNESTFQKPASALLNLCVQHKIVTDHLIELSPDLLPRWHNTYQNNQQSHALDLLYSITS